MMIDIIAPRQSEPVKATATRHPPHILGAEVMIAVEISPSGFEQKEKTCKNCGAVRVTMIGSVYPRAWRRTSEGPQITTTIEPPCNKDAGWPR